MKISLIIPVYNDERVSVSIESVIEQDFSGEIELIIVDGGSTDQTLDIIRGYGDRISKLITEPDNGIFEALNKGVRSSSGDVIGLLGADDRLAASDILETVSNVLVDEQWDGCYGDLIYVNDHDDIVRYWRSGRFRRSKLYLGWVPPHFSLYVRRDVYDRYGVFDTKYRVAADYEFQLRLLLEHRINLTYIPRVMIRMTLGGNSNKSLRNIVRANYECWQAWRKYSVVVGTFVLFLKPGSKIIQYVRRPKKS